MEVTLREKGRIKTPDPLRESLGLKEGDRLEVTRREESHHTEAEADGLSSAELRGIIDPIEVDLEEVGESPGREVI